MEVTATKSTLKRYLIFWTGQQFSLLGSSVVQFVIPLYIVLQTESAVYLSIASFFAFLPQFILMPLAGVYVDRLNRKLVIAISDSFQALSTFSIILLFFLNLESIWVIIIINSIRGLCQAFHWPATNAIIPLMIPKEHLSRLNGLNYFFIGLISTIGPLIAASLIIIFPIEQILWVDIVTFLIAIIPLILIKIPKISEDIMENNSFLKELMEGIKVIRSVPGLLILLFIATMINFFGQPFSTLLPYFITIFHGGSEVDLGIISAIIQGGMFLGAIIVSLRKHWRNKAVIIFSGLIIGDIGHLMLSFAPLGNYLLIGIGGLIFAFIIPFVNTMFLTILQSTIPHKTQGRVMSIVLTIATAVSPLAMILSGPLAEMLGVVPLFAISAGLDMTIVTLIWIFTGVSKINYDEISEMIENYNK